jgi:cyclopropane-fatty-acyl-phospholipid synthase
MPSGSTAPLRQAIERSFPDRPFSLELWDGARVPATAPGGPAVRVRSPRTLGHLLRAPGLLGVIRAHVAGWLDADDLDAVLELAGGSWRAPRLGLRDRFALIAAAVRAAGPAALRPPAPPAAERIPRGRLHAIARDAASVRHHYDLPPEFFALFLDESMTYSCALFRDGAVTLEEAQEAKLELVCRKLALRPGQRVLDIGCGWGSFAIHAATRHGARVVGITLSPPQAEVARRRAAAAGVADRVDIRVMDYREVGDGDFDAVCSIGMVEHVGEERLDDYARIVAGAVRPGGRVLNHGIAPLEPGRYSPSVLTERYIFPDGELPRLSRVIGAFERAGLEMLHVEGLRADYERTLGEWTKRLDAHRDEAERLAGPERTRVWRLYLRGARDGFAAGRTSVFQVLLTAPATRAAPSGHADGSRPGPRSAAAGRTAPRA